jgi:hypothetical protein
LNIDDLFVNWSKRVNKKYNTLLLMAAAALLWAIRITRNEIVFDKCKLKSFLQILFRGTHGLCQWHDLKDQMIYAAQHLETSALEFFSSNSWLSHRFVDFA